MSAHRTGRWAAAPTPASPIGEGDSPLSFESEWRERLARHAVSGTVRHVADWTRTDYGYTAKQIEGKAPRIHLEILMALARDVQPRKPELVDEFLRELLEVFGRIPSAPPAGEATTSDVLRSHAATMRAEASVQDRIAESLRNDGEVDADEALHTIPDVEASIAASERLLEQLKRRAGGAR